MQSLNTDVSNKQQRFQYIYGTACQTFKKHLRQNIDITPGNVSTNILIWVQELDCAKETWKKWGDSRDGNLGPLAMLILEYYEASEKIRKEVTMFL